MLTVLSMANVAAAQDTLLPGQIFDFQSTHPDFGLPAGSGGEVSGLVDLVLNGVNRPEFLGVSGLQLSDQALDADGEPIAPHLYSPFDPSGGPLVLENQPNRSGSGVFDTYDPGTGYDPGTAEPITGDVPLTSGIPNISPPPFGGGVSKVTKITYKNEKSGFDISGEFHCDTFEMRQSVMNVVADTVIRVDSALIIRTSSEIHIAPGATLTFWFGGTATVENQCYLNMGGDHTALMFNNFGTGTFYLQNHSFITASMVAPNGTFHVENNTDYYGAVTAQNLVMENSHGVHLAGEIATASTCYAEGDTQMASGSGHDGGVTSNMTFNTWFASTPGLNQIDTHQIFLNQTGGVYSVTLTDWDPINGELYGNEGQARNSNFTFAGESLINFNECAGQYFEIATNMDCWVYVDDELVIDMGGVTGVTRQRIEFDRLGLTPGYHRLRVFLAARTNAPVDLEIETTIPLTRPVNMAWRADPKHD
ncbi:MAG: fibro-slime domain-containing protein [Phycisphaerales bacterium JB040]